MPVVTVTRQPVLVEVAVSPGRTADSVASGGDVVCGLEVLSSFFQGCAVGRFCETIISSLFDTAEFTSNLQIAVDSSSLLRKQRHQNSTIDSWRSDISDWGKHHHSSVYPGRLGGSNPRLSLLCRMSTVRPTQSSWWLGQLEHPRVLRRLCRPKQQVISRWRAQFKSDSGNLTWSLQQLFVLPTHRTDVQLAVYSGCVCASHH